jgi:hypothetical protein
MRTRPRDRNMQAQFNDLQVGGRWGAPLNGEGREGVDGPRGRVAGPAYSQLVTGAPQC